MRYLFVTALTALIVFFGIPALSKGAGSNHMIVFYDHGGLVYKYIELWEETRRKGTKIMILGRCISSCTLLTGIIPRERICVGPNAVLAFHYVSTNRGDNGEPRIYHEEGTKFLWSVYPRDIQRWITRNGGLQEHLIFLSGKELQQMFRKC